MGWGVPSVACVPCGVWCEALWVGVCHLQHASLTGCGVGGLGSGCVAAFRTSEKNGFDMW